MAILNCIIGIIFIFLVAFLISNNKKKINWKTVIIGSLIQFIFAFAALKWSVGKYILSRISLGVQSVIDYAKEGISFIFGSLFGFFLIFFTCFLTLLFKFLNSLLILKKLIKAMVPIPNVIKATKVCNIPTFNDKIESISLLLYISFGTW